MKILGIGAYAPGAATPSTAFDARLGLGAGTVEQLTGVRLRHVCPDTEDQISMGLRAAQAALNDAGLQADTVDLIISASAVPYQPIPATAPLYQSGLNIPDGAAFAFDVNSTCLSFVTALQVCQGLLAGGSYRRALIISSEVASRALPWADKPEVAGLFGDGAAAVVVEAGGQMQCLFRTYPSAYECCGLGAGGTRFDFHAQADAFAEHSLFDMDGRDLFRITNRHFGAFTDDLLKKAGWAPGDIDLVVPHQASPRALDRMIRHCGFDPGQVVNIAASMGNQIAASIPVALHYAKERLRPGAKVLLLGTSAGVSFGGAALVI